MKSTYRLTHRLTMRSKLLAGGFVLVGVLAFSRAGQTGPSGFRCPTTGKLISVGHSLHEVRTRCREPDDALASVEARTIRERVRRWVEGVAQEVAVERTVDVPVEDWTYDFGRNRFIQFLRFEYGRLISVREGGKGTGDPE